jgi:predicted  nucleic acid-binding Zn-ribbon protein
LSDKYYNGEIDEKTFREYYTPLYEEGKKHMSINIVSPDELLRKNNNTRVVELDEEFRKLNDQAKKGELSLDDYNKKYADLKENAKKWANDKQLANIDKNKVSDKKVSDAYTKAENKKNKKK